LLGKVKTLTEKDGYGIPGGVVMQNKVVGCITPAEVLIFSTTFWPRSVLLRLRLV